ncbi:g122 [Coccomyxa elongata]
MENTLNNALFERACQLISLIASTSSEAVSTLVRHPFLDIMSNCLQQSTQILAEHGTGGSGWDSPSTAFDEESFPGNDAIQAAFDALEAVAEDAAGASALAENQQLVASLLSLLQAPVDVSVRGRAAALIAELDAEDFHRPVVQDAGAMHTVLSLVLTASSDEDYGEACWALLAAVARFMQTIQPPLEVLCEIAKGSQELIKAGTQQIDSVAPEGSSAALECFGAASMGGK